MEFDPKNRREQALKAKIRALDKEREAALERSVYITANRAENLASEKRRQEIERLKKDLEREMRKE